ncbi:MAG: hypothetical protein ACT4QD_20610 [Acidobacteriota bacterium]
MTVAIVAQLGTLAAIDLDVTAQDVEQALTIARSSEAERARFHQPYVRRVNLPLVESIEVVSEYRRVVLLAEERVIRGDRLFGYSVRLAQEAAAPWKRRLSVVARLRFHPQNTYVAVPDVEIVFEALPGARIGVLKQPVESLPSLQPSAHRPILGALVEGVFDAVAVGDGRRDFSVRLEGKEVASVSFDLTALR